MATTVAARGRAAAPAPVHDERCAALAALVEMVPAEDRVRARWRDRFAAVSALPAEERAQVAVVGQFSSGKSTFLNRFLADPHLLATSTLPTTPVATELVGASRLGLRITVDGSTFESSSFGELVAAGLLEHLGLSEHPAVRSMDDLIHLVTGDGDFHRRVTQVRVLHPARRLRPGTVIVDTPGVGSTEPEHLTRTMEQLALHADAVVVVLSAAQGVSTSLAEFLVQHLDPTRLKNTHFVVTRTDQVPADELPRVVSYIRRRLEAIAGPGVHPWVLPPDDADALLDALSSSLTDCADSARVDTVRRFVTDVAADVVRRGDERARDRAQRRATVVKQKLPAAAPRYRSARRQLVELYGAAGDALRAEGQEHQVRARSEGGARLQAMLAPDLSKQRLRAAVPALHGAVEEIVETFRRELLALCDARIQELERATDEAVDDFAVPYRELLASSTARGRPTVRLNARTGLMISTSQPQLPEEDRGVVAGTAAVTGAVVGTLVMPGLGTLIGGALGGGLGSMLRRSAADVRREVLMGAEKELDSGLTRVLDKVMTSAGRLLAKRQAAALERLDVRRGELVEVHRAFEAERVAESRRVSRELNSLTRLLDPARSWVEEHASRDGDQSR